MKLRFLFIFILFFFLVFYHTTNASSVNKIIVEVSPENPSPNEDTSITLNSYSNNLNTVLIQWVINGKTVLSGVGKKTLSIKAPKENGEYIVSATLDLPDGKTSIRVVIRPSSMVMLWQATDSYIPPFYKGKALPTPESEVRVVAMPEIKSLSKNTSWIDPKNLTYTWQKDNTNDVTQSGYSKNYFTYISDYLESSNSISVTASTIDQKLTAENSIDISMYQPKIVFYKKDKNIGTIWEKTLENKYKINDKEIIEAVPYFISPNVIFNPSLIWNWYINNVNIAVPAWSPNIMPVQAQPGTTGVSTIKLEVSNSDKIFETANKEINVEF